MEKQIKEIDKLSLIAKNLMKYADILVNKEFNDNIKKEKNLYDWLSNKTKDLTELCKSMRMIFNRINELNMEEVDSSHVISLMSELDNCIMTIEVEMDCIENYVDTSSPYDLYANLC